MCNVSGCEADHFQLCALAGLRRRGTAFLISDFILGDASGRHPTKKDILSELSWLPALSARQAFITFSSVRRFLHTNNKDCSHSAEHFAADTRTGCSPQDCNHLRFESFKVLFWHFLNSDYSHVKFSTHLFFFCLVFCFSCAWWF